MAVGNSKVKVRVADLIARVEEVQAEDEAQHLAAVAKYDDDYAKWLKDCTAAVREAAKLIGTLDYEEQWSYGSRGGSGYLQVVVPARPAKPSDPDKRHDRVLRMLRMVDDPLMILGLDHDLARYL